MYQDVRAESLLVEVPDGDVTGQLVAPQERGARHPGGAADALVDEIEERGSRDALGDQREHDVRLVVVREALAGRELHRVAVEDLEVRLDPVEPVHGDRQDVFGDRTVDLLVEEVADPRPVREQLLDRHGVVDQWQVRAEDRARGRREVERALLDERHDGQRGQALGAARDREPRLDGVRDPVGAVGEPVRARDPIAVAIDADDAGETRLRRDAIDRSLELGHGRGV